MQNQHDKIKINCLEGYKKLGKYQTRYLVKNIYFYHFYMVRLSCCNLVIQFCKSFDPKWPKCSFLAPGTTFRIFFQTLRFYWIHLTILEEMGSYLWKLESGFWTYGWMRLLGPSGPNVVSRLQVLRSRHFFKFHDLLDLSRDSRENEVLFVKVEARALDLWLDMSSGPKWHKSSF